MRRADRFVRAFRSWLPVAGLLVTVGPIFGQCLDQGFDHALPGPDWITALPPGVEASGIAVGDVNRDGLSDLVVSLPGSPATLRVFLASEPGCWEETHTFETPQAGRVVLADLTGDGNRDAILFGRDQRREPRILAGDGFGGFAGFATLTQTPGSFGVLQHAIDDLDGDGAVDLVYVDGHATIAYGPSFDDVHVVRGEVSDDFVGVVVRDLDDDGAKDILLAHPQGVQVLTGGGDREFTTVILPESSYGTLHEALVEGKRSREIILPSQVNEIRALSLRRVEEEWVTESRALSSPEIAVHSFIVEDFDRDGNSDLAYADVELGLVEVAFGRSVGGLLEFPDPPLRTGWAARAAGGFASTVIEGSSDVDADGTGDIVFHGAVLRVRASRSLNASVWTADRLDSPRVAVADFDADGRKDLVRLARDRFELRFGGSRGLSSPRSGPVSTFPGAVAAGILDASGRMGVIFSEPPVLRRFEFVDGAFRDGGTLQWTGSPPESLVLDAWDGVAGGRLLSMRRGPGLSGILSLHDVGSPAPPRPIWSVFTPFRHGPIHVADLDDDGWSDVVHAVSGGALVGFGDEQGLRVYSESAVLEGENLGQTAAADTDGDGVWEAYLLPVGSGAQGLYQVTRGSDGRLQSRRLFDRVTRDILAADVDADGLPELLAMADPGLRVFDRMSGGELTEILVAPYGLADELAFADVDGNGRGDIITKRFAELAVLFAEDDGRFVAPSLVMEGCDEGVELNDFDGDGVIDIVADCGSRPPVVLTGAPQGGFSSPTVVRFGAETPNIRMMTSGDVDGDGRPDLVVSAWDRDGLRVARGLGDGRFAGAVALRTSVALVGSVVAADIDQDGVDDVVASEADRFVRVWRGGNAIDAVEPSLVDTGLDVVRVVSVVDLDGDSRPDLVCRGEDSRREKRWRVMAGATDGTLLPPVELPPVLLPGLPSLVGDLDGDGRLDTVRDPDEGRSTGVQVLLGRGDFVFEERAGLDLSDVRPAGLVDIDGDGALDLVGTRGGTALMVARGVGDGSFERPVFFASASTIVLRLVPAEGGGLVVGDTNALSWIPFAGRRLLGAPRQEQIPGESQIEVGDFDRNGREEIVVFEPPNGRATILAMDRDEGARIAAAIEWPTLSRGPSGHVRAGDIDGDGTLDLAYLVGGALSWSRGDGNGSFDVPSVVATDMPATPFSLVDIDGDGDLDVLVASLVIVRNLGGGRFSVPDFRGVPSSTRSSVGDFDGDGHLDVLHDPTAGPIAIFSYGDGTGEFDSSRFLPTGGIQLSSGGIAVADFDGDGRKDVAVSDRALGVPAIWYGSDGRAFRLGPPLVHPIGRSPGVAWLRASDLDQDGFADLVVVDRLGATIVYPGGREGLSHATRVTHGLSEPAYFFLDDFTGDKVLDAAFEGEAGLFLGIGTGRLSSFVRGDSNRDARVDIADPIWIINELFRGGPVTSCAASADANHDGVVDLSDAAFLINYQLLGGAPPGPPFPDCGEYPEPGAAACDGPSVCGP